MFLYPVGARVLLFPVGARWCVGEDSLLGHDLAVTETTASRTPASALTHPIPSVAPFHTLFPSLTHPSPLLHPFPQLPHLPAHEDRHDYHALQQGAAPGIQHMQQHGHRGEGEG